MPDLERSFPDPVILAMAFPIKRNTREVRGFLGLPAIGACVGCFTWRPSASAAAGERTYPGFVCFVALWAFAMLNRVPDAFLQYGSGEVAV
jgi:hypothetical protein